MIRFLGVGAIALLAACASPVSQAPPAQAQPAPPAVALAPPTPAGQRELELLARFFAGTYEPVDRARTTLRAVHAPFGPQRAGEHWIHAAYFEGSAATPLRQAVYRLREDGGAVIADVFAAPTSIAAARTDNLRERSGCRIRFQRTFETWWRAETIGKSCPAERPGAAYETTYYEITSSELRVFARAFDASGRQVAGDKEVVELRKASESTR